MPCSVDARRDHGRAHPRGGPTGCGTPEWSAGRRLALGECAGRTACGAGGSSARQRPPSAALQPPAPAAPRGTCRRCRPDRRTPGSRARPRAPDGLRTTAGPPSCAAGSALRLRRPRGHHGPSDGARAHAPAGPGACARPPRRRRGSGPREPEPDADPRGADRRVGVRRLRADLHRGRDPPRRLLPGLRAHDHARDARLRPAPHGRRAAHRPRGRQPAADPGHRGAHPRDDHADHVLDRHPAAAGALRGDPRARLLLRPAGGGPVPRQPLQAARLARARPSG